MAFALADATLPVRDEVRIALQRVWTEMAQPGSFFTGAERVGLAAAARGEAPPDLPATRAARKIYVEPWDIDGAYVDALVADGLSREAYVEVMAVVTKLAAIDTTVVGLGGALEPLPDPAPGAPTGAVDPDARKRSAFVPTVGAAFPPSMLSVIPGEWDRQADLSAALYLSYEEMMEFAFEGDLDRAQMELVAATTSLVNECFW